MRRPRWMRDTITRRFALAIAAAAAAAILVNLIVDITIGGPAFPPRIEPALLEQLPGIVHTLDAAPRDQRDALARAASMPGFHVAWSDGALPFSTGGWTLPSVTGSGADAPLVVAIGSDSSRNPHALLAMRLADGSTLIVTPADRARGFMPPRWWALRIGIFLLSVFAISLVGAGRLARPIDAFAAAARRFGTDPNASPMVKQGPAEMQQAIAAFNAMQGQIQRFVSGQAAMFAAVSHDLRTPLTRMRLRGEFIDDQRQQARLFRDVDEMVGMIDAALVFLRDNASAEATTRLDLAEVLRSIVDDHADLGTEVAYAGPRHVAYPGRPSGLRRAFGNFVDNAVKYGGSPDIDLSLADSELRVTVSDRGPGIPPTALEDVFTPFLRLEPSRNRNTGGMGLGLTSARACIRAHGGDVVLSNRLGGGLQATVILPLPRPTTRQGAVSHAVGDPSREAV